jgi:antitoxin MazE
MKINVVRIGNSRGVRLPKAVIRQCGFADAVELTVKGRAVILAAAHAPRAGWDAAFADMARRGDDRPVLDTGAMEWDEKEWRW